MSELPEGWTETTLGSLGRYLNGRAFKKSEWADTGRPIIRIQNLTGSNEAFNYFSGDVEERYIARPGDLLVSWAATLGAYFWNGPEAVVNQHIFKVESNIDVRFHKYLLDYKLGELMRETHGSGIVHITRGKFDSLPVSVPPIEEQRRIVDTLERSLSQIDAGLGAITKLTRRAAQLQMSSLEDAISQAVRCAETVSLSIGELARVGSGATPLKSRSDYYEGGTIPWVTSGDLVGGVVSEPSRWITERALKETAVKLWPSGTILVAMYGEGRTRGTVAQLQFSATTNQACAAIVLHERSPLTAQWVKLFLEGQYGMLRRQAAGGVQPNLSLGLIKALEVPLPPTYLIQELVQRQREWAFQAQVLEAAAERAAVRAKALKKGLLAASFAGRLASPATLERQFAGV